MSKHSKHVSTLGCSTNFGDITLTKICVLRILHQDRHTGANLIVQVCFCNTTVQTNDITSARWLHCHHRYSDFSLCKSIVVLFYVSGLIIQTQTGKHISTRRPVFIAFLSQVFILPYQSLLSSFIHTIHLVSISAGQRKKKSTAHRQKSTRLGAMTVRGV